MTLTMMMMLIMLRIKTKYDTIYDNDADDDDCRPHEGNSVRETASFQTGRSRTMFIPVLDR